MASKEVPVVSSKRNPDDIVVVAIKPSWKDWMMMATAGAAGALGGGTVILIVSMWIGV